MDGYIHSGKRMEGLAARAEITVKGKRCLIINPNRREIAVKVHWVLPKVPDELLIRQFKRLGRVERVVREGWRNPGLTHMTGTTRVIHIAPTTPTSLEALPHQATINGSPILIEVAGPAIVVLALSPTGHCHKNCMTPWCRACRAYGHDQTGCTQSYAARVKQRTLAKNLEEYMDAEEMAAMLNGKEPAVVTPQSTTLPPHAPSPPFEERKGHEQDGRPARDASEPNVLAETASPSETLPAALPRTLQKSTGASNTRQLRRKVRVKAADTKGMQRPSVCAPQALWRAKEPLSGGKDGDATPGARQARRRHPGQ